MKAQCYLNVHTILCKVVSLMYIKSTYKLRIVMERMDWEEGEHWEIYHLIELIGFSKERGDKFKETNILNMNILKSKYPVSYLKQLFWLWGSCFAFQNGLFQPPWKYFISQQFQTWTNFQPKARFLSYFKVKIWNFVFPVWIVSVCQQWNMFFSIYSSF